ncbi:hypothetical protein OH540_21240 [Streptomyces sp. BPPL-273]|uniref:hypothetical protein n=1 Tax=Streptomyces sp. BPPL-273 TaxID=2987533 RepID=UPI0024AF4E39|nr:hypothetical protein [Streptomyces sp. BPPL-273]WHM32430.1 hypothetical protein OH540_21240 [Streptomyces sp. BPPL-273]
MNAEQSIDRVDDAHQAYLQACRTHGADSPQAKAADQNTDAEEARHNRDHAKPFLSY